MRSAGHRFPFIVNSKCYELKNRASQMINGKGSNSGYSIQQQVKTQNSIFKNMSNIHGFNNIQQNNRRPSMEGQHDGGFLGGGSNEEPLTVQNLRAVEKHKVLFLSGRRKVKDPRDQSYWDMLMEMCCPVFRLLSFTTIMMVIYLALFITQAIMGLQKQGQLLQINAQTLIKLGANVPYLIRQGGVWRLITAAVLHVNFMHFFGNFASTIILLSRFQYSFGTIRCIIIYILTAIAGNIFSALCSPNTIKAGASTCLYGILGIMIGYMVINWHGLSEIGPLLKCQLTCLCMMLIVFTILFTSVGPSNIDIFGHLGGFLAGLWLSAINPTIKNGKWEKGLRIVAVILLVAQFVICFVLFYVLKINFASP